MNRNESTREETALSVLPSPPAFQRRDWQRRVNEVLEIQESVRRDRDRNPVGLVDRWEFRAADRKGTC